MGRTRNPEPSLKQLELYRWIIAYIEEHGYQPSQAEMGAGLSVGRGGITERLRGLNSRGFIKLPKIDRERAIILPLVKFRAIAINHE
jgi:SOS-response transcriptional repressor LexA